MTFVDILTSQLFALGFVGLTLVYMVVQSYVMYMRGKKHADSLRSGSVPLAALGFYIFITGLYGQFTWPLPGSYNILFYDVYVLVGLLFVGFAWALRSGVDTQNIGFLSLLVGVMTIYYGWSGYILHLTEIPLALLGLYVSFGVAGVLGWPVTVMLDRARGGVKNRSPLWVLLVIAFALFLVIGSLLAMYIAASAIPVHLVTPP